MIYIAGGMFRMDSDRHYPEEAPSHRVSVDGFWIDPTPVTNRQFKAFVKATGYRTTAEVPPDPKDYSGALPCMIYAGSLVFTGARPVRLRRGFGVTAFARFACRCSTGLSSRSAPRHGGPGRTRTCNQTVMSGGKMDAPVDSPSLFVMFGGVRRSR